MAITAVPACARQKVRKCLTGLVIRHVYEINIWVWLSELSKQAGKASRLAFGALRPSGMPSLLWALMRYG